MYYDGDNIIYINEKWVHKAKQLNCLTVGVNIHIVDKLYEFY